jgi:hypothetical protein
MFVSSCDSVYVTGQRYFEACWAKKAATKSFDEPKASSPAQSVMWKNCEMETERAVYSAGIIFDALPKYCPSSWSDIPMGGAYLMTIDLVEEQGGPRFVDHFLPARVMIQRVWTARWPRCDAERRRQGYPKIVEKTPGNFQWEQPCPKCQ